MYFSPYQCKATLQLKQNEQTFVQEYEGRFAKKLMDGRIGPIYMVSGTRDNPPPRDNFTERLYDKKLSRLTEIKLTLLNYSEILL